MEFSVAGSGIWMHVLLAAGFRDSEEPHDPIDVLAGTFNPLQADHVQKVIEVAQGLDVDRKVPGGGMKNMKQWCSERSVGTRAPRKRKQANVEESSPSEG
jgi:hypothetical protein